MTPVRELGGATPINNDMRATHTSIFWILAIVALGVMFASVVSADDFASMSLEDAEAKIRQVSTSGGYQSIINLVQAAVHSKRFDLVSLCFEFPEFDNEVVSAIRNLPNSIYKDQLVLLTLKGGRTFWPKPSTFMFRPPMDGHWIREPFASVLEKYLPHVELEDDSLRVREQRLELAVKLEAAIMEVSGQPVPDVILPHGGLDANSTAGDSSAFSTVDRPSPATKPAATIAPATGIRWIVCGVILVAVLVAWLLLRSKRTT